MPELTNAAMPAADHAASTAGRGLPSTQLQRWRGAGRRRCREAGGRGPTRGDGPAGVDGAASPVDGGARSRG
ncbi:Os02g0282150 [Oryza sativa Japonica Group]|uniref:Os02g0282150 protein n=1 Tax=Oryza sativa subsp. japonica TaxID=39947 RepID=A0A0P0VHR3_ORYSJ|nr:Os02g0282150 [Oryza sativa Japonica Group]